MSNTAATRALMELGAFDAIPTGGKTMTADELAARTGGEKGLIGESRLQVRKSTRRCVEMIPYSSPHEERDHVGTVR